jgi:hypothetical protein
VGSVPVGGIVRDMDVAHEAYMDVLAAVPPTGTETATSRSDTLAGLGLRAQPRFSTSM